MRIYDSLPFGRENAITSKNLASTFGFSSTRALQSAIESERRAGAVILSTTENGGGYFRSNEPHEIQRFIRTLNSRAKHTAASTLGAQVELDKLTGQTRLDGM